MKAPDADIRCAIAWIQEEAELNSDINGPEHDVTRQARRVEVTLRRLAREAGYDLNELGAEYE